MNILSILANPKPDSFCHAIAAVVHAELRRLGHRVVAHDLYHEGFDPVLRADEAYTHGDGAGDVLRKTGDPLVLRHRQDIAAAEGLVVVHPNWWGKPPAILAGWLDRVLVPGVAYSLTTGEGAPEGLLTLGTCLVLNTSDTPAAREAAVLGDPLDLIWRNCVLPYCGVQRTARHVFRPVAGSNPQQRAAWLEDCKDHAGACFPREG